MCYIIDKVVGGGASLGGGALNRGKGVASYSERAEIRITNVQK